MRKILVSAYACEPFKGSEQGVGWNWIIQLAKNNEVHVITRANNKIIIEENINGLLTHNVTFHYYDTIGLIQKFKNKDKGLFIYYFLWQIGIIPLIISLNRKYKFDYTLHLTFGSMWLPTFLPLLKIPFVWGPIGGGDGEPFSFFKTLPIKSLLLRYLRLLFTKLSFLNPFFFVTCAKAKFIIVRTKNMEQVIPSIFKSKVRVILETAMELEVFNHKVEINYDRGKDLRIITTGRLLPSKNILTAVKAISLLPNSYHTTFTIIGSGSDLKIIENEICRLELENKISIITNISRQDVLCELSKSQIYLFPSLREGGSWALMEAMAIGLPVVCLKWSGMEVITDEESAIRLPVTNPEQMPKDMAMAICKLIDNPELRKKMGEAGRNRIKNEFNWDAKGLFMEELFKELDKK